MAIALLTPSVSSVWARGEGAGRKEERKEQKRKNKPMPKPNLCRLIDAAIKKKKKQREQTFVLETSKKMKRKKMKEKKTNEKQTRFGFSFLETQERID
jgi:hypothetical protein